jgi:ABC-type polysaccharide/polyol phosphate export permease
VTTRSSIESREGSLLRSLAVQRRVIGALLMREIITRFGRHNLGVLWLVVEPMMFTVFVAALWTAVGHKAPGLTIVGFAVTGYSSVLVWRNSVSHNVHAVHQNMNLLYHRNVHLYDVFIARVLVEVAGATASFFILSVLFILTGFMPFPDDLLTVAAAWFMLAWFGTALAILIGAGAAYSDVVGRVWHPFSYILFPLSGAAFMVDWVPQHLQQYILYLPMIHGVEMLRQGYFGPLVHGVYSMTYMAACNLVISLLGLALMRKAALHLEAQ